MTLAAVEPGKIYIASQNSSSSKGLGFSDVMSALAPTAGISTQLATGNANVASLTHAAITGAAVAAGPQSGPYASGMGSASPFSSAGYGVPDNLGSGYSSGTYAAGGSSGSSGGFGAAVGGNGLPTDPFMQQDYLLNKMRDTNMQMIQIQASIQHENRRWTTNSNILKAKHDTEMAQVRNFRVT